MKGAVQARLDAASRRDLEQLVRSFGWSPSKVVREALRVLKPDGRLVIFDTAETGYYAEVLRAAGTKEVTLSPWSFLWCLPSRSVAARK